MKNFKLILGNIVLIIGAIIVIPNLSANKSDLVQEYGTLESASIETYRYKPPKSFSYVDREQLVFVTIDKLNGKYRFYNLNQDHRDHWNILLDEKAIGKDLKVYLSENHTRIPLILELDGKEIYGKNSLIFYYIIILTGAIGLTVYNIYRFFKKN